MSNYKYLKWRRLHEYVRKSGISYWLVDCDLLTNDEMYNLWKQQKIYL